jgi:hypothetical protein
LDASHERTVQAARLPFLPRFRRAFARCRVEGWHIQRALGDDLQDITTSVGIGRHGVKLRLFYASQIAITQSPL